MERKLFNSYLIKVKVEIEFDDEPSRYKLIPVNLVLSIHATAEQILEEFWNHLKNELSYAINYSIEAVFLVKSIEQ